MITLAEKRVSRIPAVTRASDPFRRYGSMDKHEVRLPQVKGTELERLRQRRQMLREMDPETVKQVIEFHRELTLFEAFALAKREGKIIVPNYVLDRIINETKHDELMQLCIIWLWTGTLIVYEAPGKPFGKAVKYDG